MIALYKHHGMHEQFHSHSEIKTGLNLEDLPSGKFDTNDAILHLALFVQLPAPAGQLGLTSKIAPIRHPAKRRQLTSVLRDVMYRSAKFVAHARRLTLDFGGVWAGARCRVPALANGLMHSATSMVHARVGTWTRTLSGNPKAGGWTL